MERKEIKQIEKLTTVPKLSLNYEVTPIQKKPLNTGEDTANFLRPFFDSGTFNFQEELILLMLNDNYVPIGVVKLFKGSREMSIADHFTILSTLLAHGVDCFVLAHNHPQDYWEPSEADFNTTISLFHKANYFDTVMKDHVILTNDSYYSFNESTFLLD